NGSALQGPGLREQDRSTGWCEGLASDWTNRPGRGVGGAHGGPSDSPWRDSRRSRGRPAVATVPVERPELSPNGGWLPGQFAHGEFLTRGLVSDKPTSGSFSRLWQLTVQEVVAPGRLVQGADRLTRRGFDRSATNVA